MCQRRLSGSEDSLISVWATTPKSKKEMSRSISPSFYIRNHVILLGTEIG